MLTHCLQIKADGLVKTEIFQPLPGDSPFISRIVLTSALIVTEQLHQNIEVLYSNVPAAELAGAVPAAGQFLLPVPAGAAADPGHLVADSYHHRHPTNRSVGTHRR